MYNQLLIVWGVGMSFYTVYTILIKDSSSTGRIRTRVIDNIKKIKRYEKSLNDKDNGKGIM